MRKLREIRSDIMESIESIMLGEELPLGLNLEELDIEAEEKLVNCSYAISKLQAEIAEADLVIKTAAEYKAARAKAVDRITQDMKMTMEVMCIDKIDRPDCRITLGKARDTCNIVNTALIPKQYMKQIPASEQPIKADLLRDLKAGIAIPGVEKGSSERGLTYPKLKGE